MTGAKVPAAVVVGRILRPHGVRGEVVVEVVSDVAGRFEPGETMEMAKSGANRLTLEVVATRPHGEHLLVRFRDIDDRDQAEAVRGASLEVGSDRVPEAPRGWYYHHELIGLSCFDAEAGPLGIVDDVIEDGGGLLLALRRDERNLLVPFVADYIREIDLQRGRIDLELPQGLVDSCTSRS